MPNSSEHPILTGLHILLTYQCNFECEHCFAWGSPWQVGTFTLPQIRNVLEQARGMKGLRWIYFEGGEPFLYYATLVKAVEEANQMGFNVGIVTNAYWALTLEDAIEWLKPFAGRLSDLSVSSDLFHYDETYSMQMRHAAEAAKALEIPCDVLSVATAESGRTEEIYGVIQPASPDGAAAVMYRGRAALKLTDNAMKYPWDSFTNCPHEDLHSPGRIHLDPAGNLHVCQGITIGNLFERPLEDIWKDYSPDEHPIIGLLMKGGPFELTRVYSVPHLDEYADACHLCYLTRLALRDRIPQYLCPDQMYGVKA